MNLKELNLKKSYDSDKDNILREFYIPVLSCSVAYKRLAGFFSSSSLAVAARGISKFIANEGHMQLITSAKLQKADIDAIRQAHESPEKIIERIALNDLDQLEDEFIRDHVRALGWMIANKRLEIKIAIVTGELGVPIDEKTIEKQGIFHQKVGILEDNEGNKISFSGSDNESATAWQDNIEEFKVFRNWVDSEKEYFGADYKRFEKFWGGYSERTKIIAAPEAIKKKLIKIAPKDIKKLELEKYYVERRIPKKKKAIKLRSYQEEAIENWLNNDSNGIFEMATGTGKTFAALGCLKELFKANRKLITVIACPYSHLLKQWRDDIEEFGIACDKIVADSTNPRWKDELTDYLLDIKNEISERLIILTTHVTLSMENFIQIMKKASVKLFLIVDEVHGVGAPERKKGLLSDYHFRLGLSATPKRWFDIEGTDELFNYFKGTVFEFPLEGAINTINPDTGRTFLVPYMYNPSFVKLTDEEMEEYIKETEKIARSYHGLRNQKEKEKQFSLLLIRRQKIITNAAEKYNAFIEIFNSIEKAGEIKDCLIYCSPHQIDEVQKILINRNIIQHKFTNREGTIPKSEYGGLSERDYLLQEFSKGNYQALVAMRCLDEGVDIPSAKIAIILASSGNPREYIQRRGRILRPAEGKDKAVIFDVIVIPELSNIVSRELLALEKTIIRKELKRYREFANISINRLECLSKISDLELSLLNF